ncbi:hypothetical protein BJY16_001796 [Actinoplanes octamycinicus]|uniref:Uncharacterized protein n=2 Tax=Actinoplanes octamycinicus TaxID=135948 RepID=A0A7W7GUB6_9ACTN|nr:hypothetical protein [Actinoplanes octamycinicus]MBB4738337.1 hypothetical protein [Actinoplanes octamycinicus]
MTFDQYAAGADPAAAFASAVADARYEYGHDGYSGTIAEKNDFVIITRQLMTLDQASNLADELISNSDPRIDNKWGPAGAIPVVTGTRMIEVPDLPHPAAGTSLQGADLDKIIRVCRRRRLLTPDDIVLDSCWTTPAGRGTPPKGTARLTLRHNPSDRTEPTMPDGWLFFGWASS